MLEHIEITGEGGIIRLKWEWGDPEIESVDIRYRKKEYEGTSEFQHRILRNPQQKYAYAERKMSGERGLYSFLLIIHFISGDVKEKWIDDIPIGGKIRVSWNLRRERNGYKITFPKCEAEIPANAVSAKYGKINMKLGYPVNQETQLLVLESIDDQKFELCIEKPYDKIIKLERC